MDIRYFPFDTQHCSLKFGSWTYHGEEIDIKPARDRASFDLGKYFLFFSREFFLFIGWLYDGLEGLLQKILGSTFLPDNEKKN